MTGPRRTKEQILRDRALVAKLYLQGRTQAEIGEELGFTQQQISYDLKQIRKAWAEAAIRDFDERIAEELARIDHLERVYWDSWQRSLEDVTTETAHASAGQDGTPRQTRAVYRTEPGLGDARWLEGVRWCVERRCKLLGLDKPDKVDLSSGGQALGRIFEDALAKVYGEAEDDEADTPSNHGDDGDGDGSQAGSDA